MEGGQSIRVLSRNCLSILYELTVISFAVLAREQMYEIYCYPENLEDPKWLVTLCMGFGKRALNPWVNNAMTEKSNACLVWRCLC